MNLVPFASEHIANAARLLTLRHCRVAEPALPAVFDAPALIRGLLDKPRAAGIAAVEGSELVGYMIGNPEVNPPVRGRSAWTYTGGQAVAPDRDPALYADMYAALFPRWLAEGCFGHFAMVPAADRGALNAWFALGFGMEQVHAIRETAPLDEPVPFLVRKAVPDDLEALAPIIHLIAHHQVLAPCWAPNFPETDAGRLEGWAEALADETCAVWAAFDDEGKAGGFAMISPAEPGLMVPERCMALDVAATRPDLRGLGLGKALTRVVLDQAHRDGFTHMITDWRSTNLLSSRFWPAQGFRPVEYRLARRIDERILWAKH
ncbi:MAG TPA: GNAT family N-acetyltransferase [Symbiobacteriaceae bacterium]|nr:GNAT family N-acetyltransferase [Symbiobacteriaceae bacterium]